MRVCRAINVHTMCICNTKYCPLPSRYLPSHHILFPEFNMATASYLACVLLLACVFLVRSFVFAFVSWLHLLDRIVAEMSFASARAVRRTPCLRSTILYLFMCGEFSLPPKPYVNDINESKVNDTGAQCADSDTQQRQTTTLQIDSSRVGPMVSHISLQHWRCAVLAQAGYNPIRYVRAHENPYRGMFSVRSKHVYVPYVL